MLYYEVHVTIEPNFDKLEFLKGFATIHNFHMGDLLLMKQEDERSRKDMFFTARFKSAVTAMNAVADFVTALKNLGYKVLRYKIEDTIIDSRIEDKYNLLT